MMGILWAFLMVGFFSLAFSGLSNRGITIAGDKKITGTPARVIGGLCLVLGVGALVLLVLALGPLLRAE